MINFLKILLIALSSLIVSGCDSEKLAMKIIEKTSFEEFISFINKAQEKIEEKKHFIFEYDFPIQSIYSIGGVVNLKSSDSYRIQYREYFIASTLDDGSSMTVIYQEVIDYDYESLVWVEGDGSNYAKCDEHLRIYDKKYILTDKDSKKIMGLKFNNASKEIIDEKFVYFLSLF